MLGSRALLFAAVVLASGAGLLGAPGSARAEKPVIELFTSQGCSSCPPADKLVGKLAENGNVIALSYPVTLWDYLGWSDTLASRDNTERQFAYAQARGDGAVYTPQMVVNGREDVVGNDEAAVLREIALQKAHGEAPSIPVSMHRNGTVLEVRVGPGRDTKGRTATIWLGHVVPQVAVAISRGENTGREIVYHNVVRSLRAIGMWKGDEVAIDLPMSELNRDGDGACVVLVQIDAAGGPGPIVGAEMEVWARPNPSAQASR
ncbi:DUF1223 domain-containing protein [Amorphus orientalis]|uniref:DUF1223 domain-containing protein n=1 Tax=Amorphus orientalis TaxID=649198 RepID=A0AAE3VS72_9HYPH|nr:DUF1223 domain-containing protein [Amorphus orientalis]MDQ0317225.1 hypothetical protein [Amorphus orientalis]